MPGFPVVPESHTHVLAEFDCLDQLLSALRLDSGRLKCTCVAVSRKWLALGTTAGGLHLIQREGWKQRLILTHKEGSITQVSCCPHDEDFIAVATSQGLVVVWELQQERRGRPERVSVSWEHRGQSVTSLAWDSSSLRVFIGDTLGKVSFLRAASSKMGKGSSFVMFPVQTITTVDSRVVQLGYHDGRLLVSSLSRCYLCDTDKEKFWRVGNKERDGEYGACFFPQGRGGGSGGPLGALGGPQQPPPLLYCARPGSRVWEASFSGEVLSTHQFKQLLACPPLPIITYRSEPRYNPAQKSSQSMAFPRLLYMGEQHLLTWTHSAIYILTPGSGQVLLWSEISDVVEVAVYRSELFCLHGDGRLSHLVLVSVERCVERLLRREAWSLAAAVCCMFPTVVTAGRARKSVPIDRLDFLRSQLGAAAHSELICQLDEVIARLEPLDSASSSRRSSISSHESFNVLDCGIYRVISRRGSQSDEEGGSLINQSVTEEERLKDFGFGQEDEQLDPELLVSERSEVNERSEVSERSDSGQFLPLPFRSKPPRIALQAVRDSVSSFVKKTTERMNSLQMNAELWQRPPDPREGAEGLNISTLSSEDDLNQVFSEMTDADSDLQELRTATQRAASQIQDPLVLLDPARLAETLLEWLEVLERLLGPEDLQETWTRGDGRPQAFSQHPEALPQSVAEPPWASSEPPEVFSQRSREISGDPQTSWERPEEASSETWRQTSSEPLQTSAHPETFAEQQQPSPACRHPEEPVTEEEEEERAVDPEQQAEAPEPVKEEDDERVVDPEQQGGGDQSDSALKEEEEEVGAVRVVSPRPLPSDLMEDLTQLATLYLELRSFGGPQAFQKECFRAVGSSSLQEEESVRPVGSSSLQEEGGARPGGSSSLQEEGVRAVGASSLQEEESVRAVGSSSLQEEGVRPVGACSFLRRYFYLLDQERVRRTCVLCFREQPQLHASFMEAMLEITSSSRAVEVFQKGDLLRSLRCLRELQPWSAPHLLAHLHRLYDRHGEAAVRSFSQFYPTIAPCDITAMAQRHHFLAYLDNLVQSQAEEQRLWFLGSLLQPESLRQEWLELALTHDAPQLCDTQSADGQARWHSHYFSWGYGRLLSLLTRLPADLSSKQKMAETCRSHGYWTGYLHLCCELGWRTEAFSTVCQLDDIRLLEEPNGPEPQSLEEWKLLVQLSQQSGGGGAASNRSAGGAAAALPNGSGTASASCRGREVTPETLTLRLARMLGPQRALGVLQDAGMEPLLSEHSTLVCHLLAVAEKRQRSLIHTMLERCDRFLWSQHA